MIQDAVIRNFEIIGEASKNIERLAPEFVAAHPELPLAFAYDMRNLLAHGYYKVDVATDRDAAGTCKLFCTVTSEVSLTCEY
jgi:uncharacterized protein with HEPN domain